MDPRWLVEADPRGHKSIDQAQSLNIYMAGVSGKRLDDTYKLSWLRGLKTTYYLRTIGATHAEKSTMAGGELNAVNADGSAGAVGAAGAAGLGVAGINAAPNMAPGTVVQQALPEPELVGQACTLRPGDVGFEECEACQ